TIFISLIKKAPDNQRPLFPIVLKSLTRALIYLRYSSDRPSVIEFLSVDIRFFKYLTSSRTQGFSHLVLPPCPTAQWQSNPQYFERQSVIRFDFSYLRSGHLAHGLTWCTSMSFLDPQISQKS